MREWHARDEAWQRARSFARRFGEPHVRLAMHGAVPIGLTPELLHLIRINFVAVAPWVAEADLLLSPICRDVGGGFYEMDEELRGLLVEELQRDPEFGPGRLQSVAGFLGAWADRAREFTHDPEWRDFVEGQALTALSYRKPEEAAEALARSLNASQRGRSGINARVIKLTQGLSAALMSQVEVVTYAVALDKLAAGDMQAALEHFEALGPVDQPVQIGNVELPAPVEWGLSEREVEDVEESELQSESELIGTSAAMQKVRDFIARVAPGNDPVLILGETGTGKDVAAHAIHAASTRSDKPFITVNCGVSEDRLDVELFGSRVRAKTMTSRPSGHQGGAIAEAQGGTLFLDEIGELPLSLQAKIRSLSVERELTRVNGVLVPVNVRILAATHRDLKEMIRKGEFVEAFYYGFFSTRLEMPPLREHREDIPILAEHYLSRICRAYNRPALELPVEVREALIHYNWPGNVRELVNVIERMVVLASGSEISLADLPPEIRAASEAGPRVIVLYGSELEPDQDAGWQISKSLSSAGYEIFEAPQVTVNSGYPEMIQSRIRESIAVIVVYSAESADSTWLLRTVELTVSANVELLAVMLGEPPPPPWRKPVPAHLHIIWNKSDPDSSLRSLKVALHQIRSKARTGAAADNFFIETEAAHEARRLILSGSNVIVRGSRRSGKTAMLRYLERILREENVAVRYAAQGEIPFVPDAICLIDDVENLKQTLDKLSQRSPTRWVLAAPAASGLGESSVREPIIELQDFTRKDTDEVNRRFDSPLNRKQLQELFDLVEGHPDLTRAIITGVSQDQPLAALMGARQGPLAEHLQTLNSEIDSGDLRQAWTDLLSGVRLNKEAQDSLLAIGLAKKQGGKLIPRNRLYRDHIAKSMRDLHTVLISTPDRDLPCALAIRTWLRNRNQTVLEFNELVTTSYHDQTEQLFGRADLVVGVIADSFGGRGNLAEIRIACGRYRINGRPKIFAVLVQRPGPPSELLDVWEQIQSFHWNSDADTPRLLEEIARQLGQPGATLA